MKKIKCIKTYYTHIPSEVLIDNGIDPAKFKNNSYPLFQEGKSYNVVGPANTIDGRTILYVDGNIKTKHNNMSLLTSGLVGNIGLNHMKAVRKEVQEKCDSLGFLDDLGDAHHRWVSDTLVEEDQIILLHHSEIVPSLEVPHPRPGGLLLPDEIGPRVCGGFGFDEPASGFFCHEGGFLADHAEKIHTPHHAIEINRKIRTSSGPQA